MQIQISEPRGCDPNRLSNKNCLFIEDLFPTLNNTTQSSSSSKIFLNSSVLPWSSRGNKSRLFEDLCIESARLQGQGSLEENKTGLFEDLCIESARLQGQGSLEENKTGLFEDLCIESAHLQGPGG